MNSMGNRNRNVATSPPIPCAFFFRLDIIPSYTQVSKRSTCVAENTATPLADRVEKQTVPDGGTFLKTLCVLDAAPHGTSASFQVSP